jgi:hypothetical protein
MALDPALSNITIKLSYNVDRSVPRNFFIRVQHVSPEIQVGIEYEGVGVSATRNGDYVRAGFWVADDSPVRLSLLQEGKVASTEYLVHHNEIFEVMGQDDFTIEQVVVGTFG